MCVWGGGVWRTFVWETKMSGWGWRGQGYKYIYYENDLYYTFRCKPPNYLLTFTTQLCINSVLSDAKKRLKTRTRDVTEIQKAVRSEPLWPYVSLGSFLIVRTNTTYVAEVWGLENVGHIDNTSAMKRFLGVPLHSSNKVLYGETGRYPLFIKCAVKCIKTCTRAMELPPSRLCRQTCDTLLAHRSKARVKYA